MRRAFLLVAALAALLPAAVAAAETDAHISARFHGAEPERSLCQRLIDSRGTPTGSEKTAAAARVAACLELARGALSSASNADLLETYRAIEALRPWASGDRDLAERWSEAERDAAAALGMRGLAGKTYSVVVRAQFVDAAPGGYAGRQPSALDQGRTSGAVDLAVETEHVSIGGPWDFSLTFDAAAEPIFVMTKAQEGVTPAFINGFATSTGFRLSRATRSTETALVGLVGGARLNSASTMFGSGSQSVSVLVASNDIGKWALFMDGSIDFRWYPRDVWLVHLETEPLDPLFHIYGGLRHDQRFHRTGDLESFADPTGRIFFGFDVDPFRVPAGRAGESGAWVTIGAAFRFEGALARTDRLPSGYQLALTANVDLLRMLTRRGH